MDFQIFNAKAVRRETGMRKQVSKAEQHQQAEQVLPREESTPGKANPCAAWGDSRREA
jgi:hypothetical protein